MTAEDDFLIARLAANLTEAKRVDLCICDELGVEQLRLPDTYGILEPGILPDDLTQSGLNQLEVMLLQPLVEVGARYLDREHGVLVPRGYKRLEPRLECAGLDVRKHDVQTVAPNGTRRGVGRVFREILGGKRKVIHTFSRENEVYRNSL